MTQPDRGPWSRRQMALLVARDIAPGSFVNLGIGLPTTVADHVEAGSDIVLHTENGLLAMGPSPAPGDEDPDLIDAGKQPVTELPGASFFDSVASFAMMRGGHLDFCVLGAYQVSAGGDLANWHTGADGAVPAVGGAMDLAIGARQVFVMMSLFARDGSPKLVDACSYPLTGLSCVDRVYTDHAVFGLDRAKGHPRVAVLESSGATVQALSDRLQLPLVGV